VGAQGVVTAVADRVEVTVSCVEGDAGLVYAGRVPFEVRRTDLAALERPSTRVMINLGNPGLAFGLAALPADGVGLARLEFVVGEHVKAHPMALERSGPYSRPSAA
jgi:pyruvate,water dikinase